MNTREAIASRKSTRAYTTQRISAEELDAILMAADASPVAMAKYDSLHITVVESEDIIERINDLTSEMFSRRTGMKKNTDFGARTMVFVSTIEDGLPPEMSYANVGIVVENMVLAATDMGISSVILGGAPMVIGGDTELIRAMGIPEGFRVILGAAFGYAASEEPPKEHKISVNRV